MAPVFADHPFPIHTTPEAINKKNGVETDMFDHCASEMLIVHRMMVLALNSIYLQAPHIQPADAKAFCRYIIYWHDLLSAHHEGEEAEFFPDVEQMSGEKGIMEANVKQHHAFHDGLHAFRAYIDACYAGTEKYDGAKTVGLIDAFATTLVNHLADEIPTIQGLRKFGTEKMADLQKKFDEEGEKNMKKVGLMGLTVCFGFIDVQCEDGLWANWPPAPGVLKFLIRNVFWWFAGDLVKFAPCDRHGNMRPLYAVPAE